MNTSRHTAGQGKGGRPKGTRRRTIETGVIHILSYFSITYIFLLRQIKLVHNSFLLYFLVLLTNWILFVQICVRHSQLFSTDHWKYSKWKKSNNSIINCPVKLREEYADIILLYASTQRFEQKKPVLNVAYYHEYSIQTQQRWALGSNI
jgi:hypothetical protein